MRKEDTVRRGALVADIGGTNARFALADLATLDLSHICRIRCAAEPNFAAALSAYLASLPLSPVCVAIAVAAPVLGEEVHLTNSTWSFTKRELRRITGLDELLVLNDFEALAHALPYLSPSDLRQIGGGEPEPQAPKLVLGPGTGLGVAGLVWSGNGWIAVAGEGGHVSLGAKDERELALLERLRQGRAHLSAERVLSGPGLANLYRAIAASRGESRDELEPDDILVRGLDGEDDLAVEALDFFVACLGSFAGDATLLFGARGGVYLGGGIAPKILPLLARGSFRESFAGKGRMTAYLETIPVFAILAELATLKGAAEAIRARQRA